MKNEYTIDISQLQPIDVLDNEELELYNELKSGNYAIHTNNDTLEKYAQIFKEAEQRRRSISLRLKESDYIGIKAKAMKLGMPYQSLINSIIHRFLSGELHSSVVKSPF